MIRSVLFVCAIVALIAFVAAYVLDARAQQIRWKQRALYAAPAGGILPMTLLALAFAASGDPRTRFVSVYLVLGLFGFLLSLAVGYPVAYGFTRRCARSRQADVFK